MTKPMRRALLNAEISLEARRIAHAATKTCWGRPFEEVELPNLDDRHTANCNKLKREIEQLVLTVKFAEKQPSERPEPPPFELQSENVSSANEESAE